MNFEMQDIVGSWCFVGEGRLCKIAGVYLNSDKTLYSNKGWKPRYPIQLENLYKGMDGKCYWQKVYGTYYLIDVNILTPEVAEIFMQANGLYDPTKRRSK